MAKPWLQRRSVLRQEPGRANPRPTNSNPNVNLVGLDGSRLRSATHSQAKTGARMIRIKGWTNWNQLAGNSKPNTLRLVLRSAKRFSEDPACS